MTTELGTTAQTQVAGKRRYGRRALQDEALKALQGKNEKPASGPASL